MLGSPAIAQPAAAATITVTSLADSGAGTLRQAISDAAAGDTITFSASISTPAAIALTTPLTINKDLTIVGLGSSNLTLNGGGSVRIFAIYAGTLYLSNIKLQNARMNGSNGTSGAGGTVSGLGGAVYVGNGGGLAATNVIFTGNTAFGGNGGPVTGGGGGDGGDPGYPGSFGGGGGSVINSNPANGGFGGGGGGASGYAGAPGGEYGGKGADGPTTAFGQNGGGGGAGMGGAVFIDTGGAAGFRNTSFTNNTAQGGNGGSGNSEMLGGGAGGGGAGLGSAIFNNGDLCIQPTDNVTFSGNTTIAGIAGTSYPTFDGVPSGAQGGQAVDTATGIFDLSGGHSCVVWDRAPTDITFTATTLYEGQPAGTQAGTLATTDPDATDTFTYSLVSGAGSTDNVSFTISGNSLVTSAVLSYATKSTYAVRVRTTDPYNKYYEEAFTITLRQNTITLSNNSLAENQPAGTVVGAFTSPDPNSASFAYTMVSTASCSGTDNGAFSINATKQLISAQSFDYDSKSSYLICIHATDNTNFVFDMPFTIQVTNVNEAPTNITLTPGNLDENSAANSSAGTFATTDPDATDTFTYQLVSGAGSTDNDAFTISGDQLLINASPDYESRPSYSIRVRSTDAGGLWVEKAITVTITNLLEGPTAIDLSSTNLDENVPAGASVGILTSVDPDTAGTAFVYELVSGAGDTHNSAFTISGDQLLIDASPNYEVLASYNVRVRSTDEEGLWLEKAFTITINDLSEAPKDITLTPNDVDENSPADTIIGTLTTSDDDTGDVSFTYALVSGTGDNNNASFTLVGDQLQINVSPNYEAQSSYSVRVRSTDAEDLSLEKALPISVNDVNEPSTGITFTPASLAENEPSGTSAGTLGTDDPDSIDTFTYTLVSGVGDTDNGFFGIFDDMVITNAMLDYETQPTYHIRVRSTDAGSNTVEDAFTITLQNVNEAPTGVIFTPAPGLAENMPASTVAGTLAATDPDAGDTTFAYALVAGAGDTDNASFAVVANNVVTKTALDYEDKASYHVRVQASDTGGLTAEEPITITIANTNDTPTLITLTPASLDENEPAGSLAGTLATVDQDAGDSFTYTLVSGSGNTDNASFEISGDRILTKTALNYEVRATYNIRVRSTDSAAAWVEDAFTITIHNVNDAPQATSIDDVNAIAGNFLDFTIPAGTFTDEDGDALTYAATLASGDPLPAWLSFDAVILRFSGTPYAIEVLTIQVEADDAHSGVVSAMFDIRVAGQAGNRAPVLVKPIPNALAINTVPFSHTFSEGTFADYDGDSLFYEASLDSGAALPGWLAFDSPSRTFAGTPPIEDVIYTIQVRAFDGLGGETSARFILGIGKVDVPPSLNQPIPDQGVSEGLPWSYQFAADTFVDANDDALTYTARLSGESALPAWLTFDASTRTFSGTLPAMGSASLYAIQVTASAAGQTTNDTFILGPWAADTSHTHPGVTAALADAASSGPTGSPAGATRLNETAAIKIEYGSEALSDLGDRSVEVCHFVSPQNILAARGNLAHLAIGTSHDDEPWQLLTTYLGNEERQICAQVSQFSLFDVFLTVTAQSPSESDTAELLPATGFAPGLSTRLQSQLAERAYTDLGGVWLEIPALNIEAPITGVPLVDGQWDVSWLANQVGWLQGSAFPGTVGNSVLSGHVVDANGQSGIFASLGNLMWGDRIVVHAFGEAYTYEVRTVDRWVAPDDVDAIQHKDRPWLSLITCHGYAPDNGSYRWRTLVQAVLVQTESE